VWTRERREGGKREDLRGVVSRLFLRPNHENDIGWQREAATTEFLAYWGVSRNEALAKTLSDYHRQSVAY